MTNYKQWRYGILTHDQGGSYFEPWTDSRSVAVAEARSRRSDIVGAQPEVLERAADENWVPAIGVDYCPECLLPYEAYTPEQAVAIEQSEHFYTDTCPECNARFAAMEAARIRNDERAKGRS